MATAFESPMLNLHFCNVTARNLSTCTIPELTENLADVCSGIICCTDAKIHQLNGSVVAPNFSPEQDSFKTRSTRQSGHSKVTHLIKTLTSVFLLMTSVTRDHPTKCSGLRNLSPKSGRSSFWATSSVNNTWVWMYPLIAKNAFSKLTRKLRC